MSARPYNVLFLCTGNSARSILAESLINHWGGGGFRGFSAGSHPRGSLHPIALELLKQMRLPTAGLRSKSWGEFAVPGAAPLDFVFTVCDNAAGELCPYWPGQPLTAHWGVPDPAAVEGSDTHHDRAIPLEYIRRHPTAGRAGIHNLTAHRRVGGILRCMPSVLAAGQNAARRSRAPLLTRGDRC